MALQAVGSMMGARGARKQQQRQLQQQREASNFLAPGNIYGAAGQLDPYFFGAMRGQQGNTGYQQGWYNLLQNPGYIDPAISNRLYTMNAQGYNNMAGAVPGFAQSAGLTGGPAGNMFEFAKRASLLNQNAQTGFNLANLQSQLFRNDLGMGAQNWQNLLQQAGGSQAQRAGVYAGGQIPQTGGQMWGNVLSGVGNAMQQFNWGGRGPQTAPMSSATQPQVGLNRDYTGWGRYAQLPTFGNLPMQPPSQGAAWSNSLFGQYAPQPR